MLVPIGALRWYRFVRYSGTDSCAMMVPFRRYYQLYRQVVSDESIIRILRSIWNGRSLANGRNNTAMSYAGVLCKAGVMKDKAKAFIEELIPDYDITEIVDYAYSHNTFGCERRRYKSRQK